MKETKLNAKNPKKSKNVGFFMRLATIAIIVIATVISGVFSGMYLKGGNLSIEFGGGYQTTVQYNGDTKKTEDVTNLLKNRVDPLGTSNINIEQNSSSPNSFNVAISKDVGVSKAAFINNISRRGYFYLVDQDGHDLLANTYDKKAKTWSPAKERIVGSKAFSSIKADTNLNSHEPEVAFSGMDPTLASEISDVLSDSKEKIYVYSDIGVLLNYMRNTFSGLQDLVATIDQAKTPELKAGLKALLINKTPGFTDTTGDAIYDAVKNNSLVLQHLLSDNLDKTGLYALQWQYSDTSENPKYNLSVDTNDSKSVFDPAKPFDPASGTGSPMNAWLPYINNLILLPDVDKILNDLVVNSQFAPFFVGYFSSDSASKFNPTTKQLTINDGTFNEEKVQQIANILNAGLSKNNFDVESFLRINQTLGADALKFAIIGLFVSLIVLSIVILYKYRLLGVVAIVIITLFLIVTLVTFTFLGSIIAPETGIALILSFALLLDSIVGLFNRLQKEYKTGKTTFNAFKDANKKSLSSAFDGNIIVLIVSLTIFWFGSRSIRGFAIMASLSTFGVIVLGIVVLRIILYFLFKNNTFENKAYLLSLKYDQNSNAIEATNNKKSVSTKLNKFKEKTFKKMHINRESKIFHISEWNFWSKATKWIIVGFGVILLASGITYLTAGAHFGQGFDKRNDFTGETNFKGDPKDPNTETLQQQINDAVIKTQSVLSEHNVSYENIYGSYKLNSLGVANIIQVVIQTSIKDSQTALNFQTFLNNDVSNLQWSYQTSQALSGQNLFVNMIIAIAISLIAIFIYVIVRFQLTFTIPLILALVFGIILTLALVSMLQITISNMIIGVVLGIVTLILINSVVIFDNIKEIKLNNNERKNKLSKLEVIAISNEGIKKSLTRTLALNSIIILSALVIVCFVPSLWEVSLSIIIGTIATFIATHFIGPWLWTFFERWRIKRYAKRIEKIKKHFVGPDEYIVKGIND